MFPAIKRLLKNTVFRLSLVAAGLFAASSLIILGYIYYATVLSQISRIDQQMNAELDELAEIFNTHGPNGLNREIIFRMRPGVGTLYAYQNKDDLTRNIAAQPFFTDTKKLPFWRRVFSAGQGETRRFVYVVSDVNSVNSKPVIHRARGLNRRLAADTHLFVAKDVERIMATSERVNKALLVSMALALSLGLISGFYLSRRFARKIDAFNKLASDVQAGDLKRRAPRDHSGDELDDLAGHLNEMLDHIDRLMIAMRYAGDSIAHDLRSPLTRLRTRLEHYSNEVKDEDARRALENAADDASELLRTFESVLRIARLEAGERREMLVPLDPAPLVEDLAELYEPACEDAGLTMAVDISGRHKINADRGLFSQAISNLLENAIKYTPKGGHIIVRLSKSKGRSQVAIIDDGPGIPQADRERVKERFVRLEKSRTAPGSGLGLALVDAIAALHGAEFRLSDSVKGDENGGRAERPGLSAALRFPRTRRKNNDNKRNSERSAT